MDPADLELARSRYLGLDQETQDAVQLATLDSAGVPSDAALLGASPTPALANVGAPGVDLAELDQARAVYSGALPPVQAPSVAPVKVPGVAAAEQGVIATQQASGELQRAGIDASMGAMDQAGQDYQRANDQWNEDALRSQADQNVRAQAFAQEQRRILGEKAKLDQSIADTQIKDSRTTGQKVGGVLSTIFAGLGDAIASRGGLQTHHADATLAAIDSLVERDLQSQRERLDKRKEVSANKLTELGLARQHFDIGEEADGYARASRLQAYGNEVKLIAQREQNAEKQRSLLELAAGIDEKAAATKLSIADRAAQRKAKAAAAGAKSAKDWYKHVPTDALIAAENAGQLTAEASHYLRSAIGSEAHDRLLGSRTGKAPEGEGQEVLPGYTATIPLEKKDVTDIRANRKTLTDIQADFERLAEIRRANKGKIISNADDERDASQIISGLTGKMNQLAGRGAPSNVELEDVRRQLLDPTDTYWRTDPETFYANLSTRLSANFEKAIGDVGVVRVGAPSGGSGANDARPDAAAVAAKWAR